MTGPLMILISGPYLTGTDGDEDKIRGNLARMEAMALPLFEKGHLAVVGEWLAWPVITEWGKPVYTSLDEVPSVDATPA
jgi:hypothetical protein